MIIRVLLISEFWHFSKGKASNGLSENRILLGKLSPKSREGSWFSLRFTLA